MLKTIDVYKSWNSESFLENEKKKSVSLGPPKLGRNSSGDQKKRDQWDRRGAMRE